MPIVGGPQQFDIAVQKTLEETRKLIAETAKRLHAEIMQDTPRPLNFVRHVDGVLNAPEEAVRADGVIVYDYNRLDVVAKRALEILREFSPVGSGKDPHPGLYRDSHRLFIDGHAVDNLSGWQPGQEISITNTVIYSPIIELGGKGGKKFKIDGGGRVYARTEQRLRRDPDVKNAAEIFFTFRAVFGDAQINQLSTVATPLARHRSGRFRDRGGTQAHNKRDVRWPTLLISPAGTTVTRDRPR